MKRLVDVDNETQVPVFEHQEQGPGVNPWYLLDVLAVEQVENPEEILYLFELADYLAERLDAKDPALKKLLEMFAVVLLFYQPSTRTYTSFDGAARKLGADVIGLQDMNHASSVAKGEGIPDTVMTVEKTYAADLIIQRHSSDRSAVTAAKFAKKPVVNAGSGTGEHVTQSFLDVYTLYKEFGRLDNLTIALVGDLKYGRTVKSLARLLRKIGTNNRVILVSPKALRMPDEVMEEIGDIVLAETEDLAGVVGQVDAVYMTRVQREWFERSGEMEEYERLKDVMKMNTAMAERMREDAIILHPFPRTEELRWSVDNNPRARYFQQMENGLHLRMALVLSVLREDPWALLGIAQEGGAE